VILMGKFISIMMSNNTDIILAFLV